MRTIDGIQRNLTPEQVESDLAAVAPVELPPESIQSVKGTKFVDETRRFGSSLHRIRTVKRFLWQLAHANIILAASAAASICVVIVTLDLPLDMNPLLIAFLVTYAVYTLNRFTDKEEDGINLPERSEFIRRHGRRIVSAALVAYPIALVLSFQGGKWATVFVVLPLVTVILYSIKWLPKGGRLTRLKDRFMMKSAVVALTLGISVSLLPVCYFDRGVDSLVVLVMLFFILREIINTVTFDLKDVEGDREMGVRTLPVVLGRRKTIVLLSVINMVAGGFFLMMTCLGYLPPITYLWSFSVVYSQVYLAVARRSKNLPFLCDVVVDLEFVFLAGIMGLFQGNF